MGFGVWGLGFGVWGLGLRVRSWAALSRAIRTQNTVTRYSYHDYLLTTSHEPLPRESDGASKWSLTRMEKVMLEGCTLDWSMSWASLRSPGKLRV